MTTQKIYNEPITWKCQRFDELSTLELYKILKLRNEVFVVEQNCPYQDCDGKDIDAFHFSGWITNELVAYTRLLPPGISYEDAASIGRVVTSPTIRRQKAGKELMSLSIEKTRELFRNTPIKIGAQLYLKKFYESFSFIQIDEGYLEDGIPHITMKLDS